MPSYQVIYTEETPQRDFIIADSKTDALKKFKNRRKNLQRPYGRILRVSEAS